jgi:hypothetical protein
MLAPKRFALPAVTGHAPVLTAQWTRERLFVSVLSPENRTLPDTLYLVAHTRGMLQYAERWDNSRSSALFPAEQLPSGVLHLLLLDARMMMLSNCELPDSAQFLIQARPEKAKSKTRLNLLLDKDDYPEVMEKPLVPVIPDRTLFVRYADKTEQKYVEEHGERMVHLQEVVVTAKLNPLPRYPGVLTGDYIMSEKQIKQVDETYIEDVFRNIPGAALNGDQLTIFSLPVIFYVDDWELSLQEVIMFIPNEIKQIEVFSGHMPYGEQKVISIRTKHGILKRAIV